MWPIRLQRESATRRKSSARRPWTKSLTTAIVTMVFRKYDVILTISLEFSLRVAIPLQCDGDELVGKSTLITITSWRCALYSFWGSSSTGVESFI